MVRDISFGFNTKFALSKGEVFLDWFRELIEKKYYGDEYEKGNRNAYTPDIDAIIKVLNEEQNKDTN